MPAHNFWNRNILLQNVVFVALKGVLCVMLNTVSMYIQLPLEHEDGVSGREGGMRGSQI